MADIDFSTRLAAKTALATPVTSGDLTPVVRGGVLYKASSSDFRHYLKLESTAQAAIESLITTANTNYLAGSGPTEIFVPAGAYSWDAVSLKSGVRLIHDRKAVITKFSSGAGVYTSPGAASTSSNLTSNIDADDTVIPVVAGGGFATGDVVMIMENTYLSGSIEVYRKRCMRRVLSVAGNNVTIDRPCRRAFTTAATGRLVKVTTLKDVVVEGGQFIVNNNSAINLTYAANCKIRGIEASGFTDYGGIYLAYSLNMECEDNYLRDGVNGDGTGYSIQVAGGSSLVNVRRTRQKKVRELPVGSYAQDVLIDGLECVSAYDSTANTHGQACMGVIFRGIRSYNSQQYGFTAGYSSHLAGDTEVTLEDFEIYNAMNNAIIVTAPDGLRCDGIRIKNGKIFSRDADSEPVYMDQCDDIEISGVTIDGQGGGAGAGRMMMLQRLDDLTLQNNRLKNFASGVYGFDMRDLTGALITGNYAQLADASNAFWLWEVNVGSGATVNSNCNVTGNSRIGGAQSLVATGTGGVKNTSNSWN